MNKNKMMKTNNIKCNTRFDALMEENNNYHQPDTYNSFKSNNKLKNNRFKKHEEKQPAKIKVEDLLNIANFPELNTTIKPEKILEKSNKYSEILKHKIKKEPIDNDLANLEHGWILFKKDKFNKIIIKSHNKEENHNTTHNITYVDADNNTENINPSPIDITEINKTFNNLTYKHELWRQQYIDLWGLDEWEKLYKFPIRVEDELLYIDDVDDNETTDEETNEYNTDYFSDEN